MVMEQIITIILLLTVSHSASRNLGAVSIRNCHLVNGVQVCTSCGEEEELIQSKCVPIGTGHNNIHVLKGQPLGNHANKDAPSASALKFGTSKSAGSASILYKENQSGGAIPPFDYHTKHCPPGHFYNGQTCFAIVLFCAKYDTQGNCQQCLTGTNMVNEKCVSNLPDNCLTVDTQNKCTKCTTLEYSLIFGACVKIVNPCTVMTTPTVCGGCVPNFNLVNGVCIFAK